MTVPIQKRKPIAQSQGANLLTMSRSLNERRLGACERRLQAPVTNITRNALRKKRSDVGGMMKKTILAAIPVLIFAACATARGPMAMTTLRPISGSTAQGTVHFQELGDGSVEVQVDLTGVPPGVHGFHVHEFGSCADNGNAAGGHFNPMSMPHAAPEAASHHAGDFGNVTAASNGEVHTRFVTRSITVSEGARSAVGKAVILHANPDDLVTQPTGNAGGRIACGVVALHQMNP